MCGVSPLWTTEGREGRDTFLPEEEVPHGEGRIDGEGGSGDSGCLRRSLLIGQLHPYNRGGHEESHPPVHLSHEPDRWDGVRYLRV